MGWRLLQAIYGAEPCLLLSTTSAPSYGAREPLQAACTRLSVRNARALCSVCQGSTRSFTVGRTTHRLFTPFRGALGLNATNSIHVSIYLSYCTMSTAISSSTVHQFYATSLYHNPNWICQRSSCLCQQQRRNYAKKAKKSVQKLSEDDQDIINLDKVESSMEAAVNALKYEYTNSIITRITPASLDKISVEIDGVSYQLKQVAQLGMPNSQTIVINMASYPQAIDAVVAAVRDAELNLNPIPEKNVIKVPIPKMTKELRQSLVKLAKASAEKCKVGVRKARQKAMTDLKKKTDVSKDSIRRLERHVQDLTDKQTGRIEDMLKAKIAELLKGS